MAKEVFNFSGNAAYNYETYRGPVMFEPFAVEIVKYIKGDEIHQLLEIACGTGRVTRHLRSTLPSAVKITATDISADMLAIAREGVGDNNIEYQVVDAHVLPYADNTFNVVVCQFGVMFFKDKAKAFKEIFRVLKPGGQLLYSTWDRTENIPLFHLVYDKHIIPFFKEVDSDRFKIPFSLYKEDVLLNLMRDAGFINPVAHHITKSSTAASAKHLVKAYLIKHSIGEDMEAQDSEAHNRAALALEKDIAQQFGDPDPQFELKVIFCEGYKP